MSIFDDYENELFEKMNSPEMIAEVNAITEENRKRSDAMQVQLSDYELGQNAAQVDEPREPPDGVNSGEWLAGYDYETEDEE